MNEEGYTYFANRVPKEAKVAFESTIMAYPIMRALKERTGPRCQFWNQRCSPASNNSLSADVKNVLFPGPNFVQLRLNMPYRVSKLWLLPLVGILALTSISAASQTFQQAGTRTSTITFVSYVTSSQPQYIYSGSFSIEPTGTTGSCAARFHAFNASQAERITGSFSSNISVSFYVMTDSFFKSWFSQSICKVDGTTDQVLARAELITSQQIGFTVRNPGTYFLLFLNYDPQNYANVNLKVAVGGAGVSVTSTEYLYSTTEFVETITSNASSLLLRTEQVGAMIALPFGMFGAVGLTLVIAIALFSLILIRRRKVVTSITQPNVVYHPLEKRSLAMSSKPSISTGYSELDLMLAGGIPERYAVVLVSPSYDESDLLIRKMIESNLASGRPTFYLSNNVAKTEDLTTRFERSFYALNPLASKIAMGRPNLFEVPDVGVLSDLNISVNQIIDARSKDAGSKLIVIDILTDALLRNKALTTRRWLSDFIGRRKAAGFTLVATLDPSIAPKEEFQTIVGLFDGVIEVFERELQERSRRFLVVKKLYGREYSDNELMLDRQQLL
jgi:KaiC/GvpD/RAD55 family RecA-like ATPase